MRNVLLVTFVFCICAAARAQETALYFNSDPGDYIGGGQQQYYTPQQVGFVATRNFDNGISFSVTNFSANPSIWWYVDFAAANKGTIVPGTYPNAVRFPFQPTSQPGLSFDGDGRGCN